MQEANRDLTTSRPDYNLVSIIGSDLFFWNGGGYSERTSEVGMNPHAGELVAVRRRNRAFLDILYTVEVMGALYLAYSIAHAGYE
ncbi:hypothetical protein J4442_03355 [Candidatus Woesearchaeota archaeon]|nr:hypothetical protein [Candidatus Woesearchaeota archaeon]